MLKSANTRLITIAEVVVASVIASVAGYSACSQAGAPTIDELFHLLAASSWVRDGTYAIADGSYSRAWMFTQHVGIAFSLFGESVATARIVPLAGAVAWGLALLAVRVVQRAAATRRLS